jgi:glycerophosphoryl diester phosphodiesterase
VFGSYTLIAVVFYYYPEIIPRKKKNKDYDFLVISHRGGSGENNENTIAAFKQ